MAIKIETINSYRILNTQLVELKIMGWQYQITFIKYRNTKQNILRLNKEYYKNLNTGEVKRVKHKENRADSKQTAYNSLKKLRDIINTNVIDINKVLWLTLTYEENMTDTKQLYKDYDKFMKRLRYHFPNYNIEYINVCEPQARGAWHCHVILIFDKTAPHIGNKKMKELWGNGNTKTNKIDGINNIGAYLTSYFSDMELKEVKKTNIEYKKKDIKEVVIDNKNKKVVKNSRLHLYPQGFRFYRKSKGIKNPLKKLTTYGSAKKEIEIPHPTFVKGIKITDTENGFSNLIYREFYNTKADYVLKYQQDGTYKLIPNKWKKKDDKDSYIF